MPFHYCFQCGHELELRHIEQREREVCPACNWIYYAQLKVGAAMLIERDNQLLLLRRNYEPWQGSWMLPAGYVEADEDPQEAAHREVLEETGLVVESSEFSHAYYFSDDPRGNGVAFVYRAKMISGEIKLNEESSAAQYFCWHEIPPYLTKGGHDQMIAEWQLQARQRDSQK
jgi:ADP-ribose pyrophosphatase YjhB (NUDIX family)